MTTLRGMISSLVFCFFLISCGPSTFLISKENRAYYFGRESDNLHRILCESGDLESVLNGTHIRDDLKSELYKYNCTEARSEQKVISLYLFLTPEEKKELKRSFVLHDYVINYVPC